MTVPDFPKNKTNAVSDYWMTTLGVCHREYTMWIPLGLFMILPCTAGLQSTVETLHNTIQQANEDERLLKSALGAIRDATKEIEQIDGYALALLLPFAVDSQVEPSIRLETMRLLCAKPGTYDCQSFVGPVMEMVEEYAGEVDDLLATPSSDDYAVPHLVREFVTLGVPIMSVRSDCQAVLLDALLEIALESSLERYGDIRCSAEEQIVTFPVSIEKRREIALRWIVGSANWPSPSSFNSLMNVDFVSNVRKVLFVVEPGDQRSINWAALTLLADYGDLASADLIRDWIDKCENPATERAKLAEWLWKIDAQHSPKMLLDYLRSRESHGDSRLVWALEKAVSIGLPKDAIRSAVFLRATQVGDLRFRVGLTRLKQRAIELGVLEHTELPNVPPPAKSAQEEVDRVLEAANKGAGTKE